MHIFDVVKLDGLIALLPIAVCEKKKEACEDCFGDFHTCMISLRVASFG